MDGVHQSARLALGGASLEAVQYLKQSCINGTIDGKRFDSCFYGTLAKGSGLDFRDLTPSDVSRMVSDYGKSIGIEIFARSPRTPVEEFCLTVHFGDNIETSSIVAEIARWCEKELRHRANQSKEMAITMAELVEV